jgi:hypothetical protein
MTTPGPLPVCADQWTFFSVGWQFGFVPLPDIQVHAADADGGILLNQKRLCVDLVH